MLLPNDVAKRFADIIKRIQAVAGTEIFADIHRMMEIHHLFMTEFFQMLHCHTHPVFSVGMNRKHLV